MLRRLCLIVCLVIAVLFAFPSSVSKAASNGQKLVISCGGGIYSINPDGSGLKLIYREIWGNRPVLSPDRTKIAYDTEPYHSWARITVINVTNPKEYFETPGTLDSYRFNAGSPAWSPDSSRIAFIAAEATQDYHLVKTGLFMMNADGTNIHFVAPIQQALGELNWSPDGQHFVASDGNSHGLSIMNADGSGIQPISGTGTGNTQDYSPVWTPDGRSITFVSTRRGFPDLFQMDVTGQNVHPLSKVKMYRFSPSWSPDGRQIAYIAIRAGHYHPYIMNADSSNNHRLSGLECFSVSWR